MDHAPDYPPSDYPPNDPSVESVESVESDITDPGGPDDPGNIDDDETDLVELSSSDLSEGMGAMHDLIGQHAQVLERNSLSTADSDYLHRAFTYHPPEGQQPAAYDTLRQVARLYATTVMHLCPRSPERTLALRAIETSSMWANKAVACENDPIVVP